jgi:lysophospholipase L1-like esterase
MNRQTGDSRQPQRQTPLRGRYRPPIGNNAGMARLKNRLFAAAALAFLTACTGLAAAGPAAAPKRSSYWLERTSFFRTFARTADVVMLGDSLTDGAEWREMFPQLVILNRGIDSDTTQGVLARVDDILAVRPRTAFVMIGINDFAETQRPVGAVFANYRSIVSRLDQAGVKVFVQSTLPCNEAKAAWKSCPSINAKVSQLNGRLATLASARVNFIDLTPALAGHGGLRSEFTDDGVHLNGPGYRQWRDAIASFMPTGYKHPHRTR